MISSSPDLPYDAITTFMTENPTENVNCYTSGIVNIGTSDKYVVFRYKYLVRSTPSLLISNPFDIY